MNIAEFEKVLDEANEQAERAWLNAEGGRMHNAIREARRAFRQLYDAGAALVAAEAFSTYDEQFDRLYRKSLEALESK